MDTAISAAIITGMIAIVAALITERFNVQRTKLQREQWQYEQDTQNTKWDHEQKTDKAKWENEQKLQERKQRYEEELWLLNLYAQRELKLHEKRIELYPQVFAALEVLSRHKINDLSLDDARKLANQINVWAYSDVGLVMGSDTRIKLTELRDGLFRLARGEMQDRTELTAREKNGARTLLIEMMRRDVSQSDSDWVKDTKSLIAVNRDTVTRNTPAAGTKIS